MEDQRCSICHLDLELTDCSACGGKGEIELDNITGESYPCDLCEGEGRFLACPNAQWHRKHNRATGFGGYSETWWK